MSDLNETFDRIKAQEKEKAEAAKKCPICFNYICSCIPAAALK